MSAGGFELFVAPHATVCRVCEEGRLEQFRADQSPNHYVRFPATFSPSHILQLGEALTRITGVVEDFGNESDRAEPEDLLFVDRLTPAWVAAASRVSAKRSDQIEKLWIEACVGEEGDRPAWANESANMLVAQFLQLCVSASVATTDLVMVWRL